VQAVSWPFSVVVAVFYHRLRIAKERPDIASEFN
jgi:hypothetical protein